jgi:hypothetical protein
MTELSSGPGSVQCLDPCEVPLDQLACREVVTGERIVDAVNRCFHELEGCLGHCAPLRQANRET